MSDHESQLPASGPIRMELVVAMADVLALVAAQKPFVNGRKKRELLHRNGSQLRLG